MSTSMTPRSDLKNQSAIDRAAALCKDGVESAMRAQLNTSEAPIREAAQQTIQAVGAALNLLVSAGAASPVSGPQRKPDAFDLSALATLTDPDAPELLALLEQAQAVAERIDLRRGRAVAADIPLSPGESRGTDLAESISEIAIRVRVEVQGPQGRD